MKSVTMLLNACTAIAMGMVVLTAPAAAADRDRSGDDDEYVVKDTERVQRSLSFTGKGTHRLEIDNVFGSIAVAAHDAPTVELTLTKTLSARTAERLEAARREVTLDVKEEPDSISFYVDGPFRECDCQDGRARWRQAGFRRSRDAEYRVRYDFVLRVPRQVELALRTVNNGDIRIEGTTGLFDISNVNGGVEMLDVAGSGDVRTVNKDIQVVFRTNPSTASSFKTVNGDVVVCFQPTLAADLRLKTFNGGLYSDFDTRGLPALTPVAERRNGKFIYKADRSVGVRVGAGGPELRFETLNGDIRILQRTR